MITWLLSSSLLILLLLALRGLLRGRLSLRLQYALWLLVLVRLLVPVSFGASPLSVGNLAAVADTAVATPDSAPAAGPDGSLAATPIAADTTSPGPSVSPADPSFAPGQSVSPADQAPASGQSASPADLAPAPVASPRLTLLPALWLGGGALLGLVLLLANIRFGRSLRRSRQPLAAPDTPLPVYLSSAVDTPCLFGLFRPAIYLPPAVAADETCLRHVLAHETTHFHQHDPLWAVLRCLCLALHWYNPLVWLAAILSRRDGELACDQATIARLGESQRLAYGQTLLTLTCAPPQATALLCTATTMIGSKKSLQERIRWIANKPRMAVYTLVMALLVALLAVGCTFTGAAEPTPTTDAPSDTTPVTDSDLIFPADGQIESILISTRQEGDSLITSRVRSFYLEEATAWLQSFRRGPQLEESAQRDEGWNAYYITAQYADGSSIGCGLDMLETDGVQYTVRRDDFPACWDNIRPGADIPVDFALSHDPLQAVKALYGEDDSVEITLYAADGSAYGTYTADKWYKSRFAVLVADFTWTEPTVTPTEPDQYRLVISSLDGQRSLTFGSGSTGSAGTMAYEDASGSWAWVATPIYYYDSIFELIRWEYDGFERNSNNIAFALTGDAAAAAEYFVYTAFGDHLLNLNPGNTFVIDDYQLVNWELREISADGQAVVGTFNYASSPHYPDSAGIWAGNTSSGSGEYEGMVVNYQEFALQKQADGLWHCVEMGTGGVPLPE